MGSLCSLPGYTQINIKVCFTTSKLNGEPSNENYTNKDMYSMSYLEEPDIAFSIPVRLDMTFHEFILKLQNIGKDYLIFNGNIMNGYGIKYIRYETNIGHQFWKFPDNKSSHDITFGTMMYSMPFIDWSTGYGIIMWFDNESYKTTLTQYINSNDIGNVSKLLGFKNYEIYSGSNKNITQNNNNNNDSNNIHKKIKVNNKNLYEKLNDFSDEGIVSNTDNENNEDKYIVFQTKLNHVGSYKFKLTNNDVNMILKLNDKFIVNNLIQYYPNLLDSKSFLFCLHNELNVCINEFLINNCNQLYTFSPFETLLWYSHGLKSLDCYLIAKYGFFLITDKDVSIPKFKSLPSYQLNAKKLQYIKTGKQERDNALYTTLEPILGECILKTIENFESGKWSTFDKIIQECFKKV